MAVDRVTLEALDLSRLALPSEPRVVGIKVDEYVDSDGADALRVTVVLTNDTTDEQLSGENSWALKSAIRESLRAHGVQLFPYIFLATEAELASGSGEE
ncbi:MAG: hypothetical protein K2Y37_19840 [Pirellulales bacterium]|nr:hypothetical protein [Pirellulales bacterium]